MDVLQDIRPFDTGLFQLSVISTDLAEAESLIRMLAEEARRRKPGTFAGKTSCVYFKFPYVPPCEQFRELRHLILRIRENTGLRANFRGVVAIEMDEWIGHEREEYFTVLLKYLYDHRTYWRIAAILNRCTTSQINRFLTCCSTYMTPRQFPLHIFEDRDVLCGLIQNRFRGNGRNITREGVGLLADALALPELKDARSLTLIERVVDEVICLCESMQNISAGAVRNYLLTPYATPAMVAGVPLINERSAAVAKENLQL